MVSLIRSKACKRCKGDLFVEYDEYGLYVECVQCGATYGERDLHSLLDKPSSNALHARPASDRVTR
jgi:hypothetical protein